jgi:hypothetical protein
MSSTNVIALKSGVLRQEVVNITMTIAKKWLATNSHNRNFSQNRVDTYATDMLADKWHLTHQGLAFDNAGVLMDGQHRLMAVVLAQEVAGEEKKISIPMMVTWGVRREAMVVIDGMLVRKIGDQLHLFDGLENGRRYEAGCRVIRFIEKREYGGKLTVDMARDIISRHKSGLEWAIGVLTREPLARAPIIGAMAYAYPTAPEEVNNFAILLRDGTGDGWHKGSPAYTLREWLIRTEAANNRERNGIVVVVLRALMAHLKKQTLLVIKQEAMTGEVAINETFKYFHKAHNKKQPQV